MEPKCWAKLGGSDGRARSQVIQSVALVTEKKPTRSSSAASHEARRQGAAPATTCHRQAPPISARAPHRPTRALPAPRERKTNSSRNVERPRKNPLAQLRLSGTSADDLRARHVRCRKTPAPT